MGICDIMRKFFIFLIATLILLPACSKDEPKEIDEWRTIYANCLNESDFSGFYVGDINNDGIPELVINQDNIADFVTTNRGCVYYFTDNILQCLELYPDSVWGKVGYLEETNQIIFLQWYGHTQATFGSVDFFLYDWTTNGYAKTISVIRESGFDEYLDGKGEYGQGYINGEEVDFDEFEIKLAEMYALLEKSIWVPMTAADEVEDYFEYLINY